MQAGDAFEGVRRCVGELWSAIEDKTEHVPAFRIETEPVSCVEWQACLTAGRCREQSGADCSYNTMLVRLRGAEDFCKWDGARLPRVVEWSRGARGDTKTLRADEAGKPCVEVSRPFNSTPGQVQCSYIGPTGMTFTMTRGAESEWTSDVDCAADDGRHSVAVGLEDSDTVVRTFGSIAAFRCVRDGASPAR
ncbi:MAG: SUMF1/EgtB/PvdO family nonheme iron enzyme [Kofleriaceae bacterium]